MLCSVIKQFQLSFALVVIAQFDAWSPVFSQFSSGCTIWFTFTNLLEQLSDSEGICSSRRNHARISSKQNLMSGQLATAFTEPCRSNPDKVWQLASPRCTSWILVRELAAFMAGTQGFHYDAGIHFAGCAGCQNCCIRLLHILYLPRQPQMIDRTPYEVEALMCVHFHHRLWSSFVITMMHEVNTQRKQQPILYVL